MVETIIASSKHLSLLDNESRYEKIRNFIKIKDFDKLLLRLIFEHDEKHKEFFYHRGRKINPTNKMILLFNYLFNNEYVEYNHESDSNFIVFNEYQFYVKEYRNKTLLYIVNMEDGKIIFSNFIYD